MLLDSLEVLESAGLTRLTRSSFNICNYFPSTPDRFPRASTSNQSNDLLITRILAHVSGNF